MFKQAFLMALALLTVPLFAAADDAPRATWTQWRGPTRDGKVAGPKWPETLQGDALKELWRVEFGPSYSGPIVSENLVFTTETKDKKVEVVTAVDRKTGQIRWQSDWPGAMTVPFFAAANGDWIRSTPAFDGERLYVAGMRDFLVCLDAKSGREIWSVDFVEKLKTPLPTFGFVCSPLLDDEAVYVQAAASFVKLNKKTGEIIWRSLQDRGGMNGSAFSSPVFAEMAGRKQILVQTREKLAGVDPESGRVLWSQNVPNYRGMNILTPMTVGDAVFTSAYQKNSWLYKVSRNDDAFAVSQGWQNNAQGYMSSPIIIDGHAYLHLANQRVTCINLATGERTWTTSEGFGKYWSMVAQGDRILALDERGELILMKANPKEFELLDKRKISKSPTWAYLAVCGDELFVRELNALVAYRWQ